MRIFNGASLRVEKGETEQKNHKIVEGLFRFFSESLCDEIKRYLAICSPNEAIEEIRLRKGRRTYLTVGGVGKKRNFSTSVILGGDELFTVFNKMCDGSLYAYSESILRGYISLPCGVRVGVCGHASLENGRIIGVYDISALNVRIPRVDVRASPEILSVVASNAKEGRGTLIFSPPAQGKTTCLRSIVYRLAQGSRAMRVSVIDTREELALMPEDEGLSLDVFSGYPKAEGIRMATLFMNPEIIVCDEIGGFEEALAIVDAQNCGVPLLATAHGSDIFSLMRKKGIAELHKARAFGNYVMIKISENRGFDYTAYSWEDAEACFVDNRRVADSV